MSERIKRLEEAVKVAHTALKSIAERSIDDDSKVIAATAKDCIEELHDEILVSKFNIGG